MVAERPLYVPRKCNASFLLSGVCGGTLRLEVAERFVLRIIIQQSSIPSPLPDDIFLDFAITTGA